MATCRFASVEGEELTSLFENEDAKNTKRTTMTAVKLFREYLTSKNFPAEFENFDPEELDAKLASFYVEMRNKDGQLYKKSTMASYRSGLQRYLRNKRDDEIDIKSKTIFNKSSKAYKCMGKELKRQGLAAVHHHPLSVTLTYQNCTSTS